MRGTVYKVIVPLLLLSACARPEAGIRVEYVDRPVIQVQKCIKKKDVPVKPSSLKSGVLPTDLEKALALALAKVTEWTKYGNQTDVIVKNCTE